MLSFKAENDDARTAASWANAYANGFAEYSDRLQGETRGQALERIQERIDEIAAEIEARGVAADDPSVAGLQAELAALQTRAADETAAPGDTVRVIERAVPPADPVSPKPRPGRTACVLRRTHPGRHRGLHPRAGGRPLQLAGGGGDRALAADPRRDPEGLPGRPGGRGVPAPAHGCGGWAGPWRRRARRRPRRTGHGGRAGLGQELRQREPRSRACDRRLEGRGHRRRPASPNTSQLLRGGARAGARRLPRR